MADPLTLAAVGAVALTEGIKFLYGQAGEALKRWRERKPVQAVAEPVAVQLPSDAFEGQLDNPRLHFEVVAHMEQELRDLRAAVADYAQGIDEVDPNDRRLLETVDGLRRVMEAIYDQQIVFKGEPRPSSGTVVSGEAKVNEVLGYVAGLRARSIIGGPVTGRVWADKVEVGAQAVGVEAETIGPQQPREADPRDQQSEP